MTLVTCVDVGSTYTKGLVVDTRDGRLVASAAHPTTVASDVMTGVHAVCRALGDEVGLASAEGLGPPRLCSSAGGGLRVAVVGQEREVSAEAGRRVALSAGGRVVHVSAGPLDAGGVRALRAATPDLILLVGGTDGGNAEVLLHNATRLAQARVAPPIVVAGNADASAEASSLLEATGRRQVVTANVVPRIGDIAPEGARDAIRTAFLAHVIGGKGLSRGRTFADLVRAPTPDAVLRGVEVLAQVSGDVIVVDIGGATTDVYSVLTPVGEDASLRREVVGQLWHARTVEADLGMRWNAQGIVEAAARERIAISAGSQSYAARVAAHPDHLADGADWSCESELATAAAIIAVRRHGRPLSPGEHPRPLADVGLVLGSGGVLRHSPAGVGVHVLRAVTADHGGGWRVPTRARVGVDGAYVLFAIGLLADDHPDAARALAEQLAS